MNLFTLDASSDNLRLHVASIGPAVMPSNGKPLGVVQFVHGMCEHKERYFDYMKWLADKGYVCVIHDHRGHGLSIKKERDLGYMYDGGWLALVNDIKVVNDWIHKNYPGSDITLFGHSMGSMAVRSYVKRYDDTVSRLFVCGCPSDNPAKQAGRILAFLTGTFAGWHYRSNLLQKLSFDSFNKPYANEKYRSAWVCSNPPVQEEYHNDPLCQYIFTANGFFNLTSLMQDCYCVKGWAMKNPSLPIHFIAGGLDPCRRSDEALKDAAENMRRVGYSDVSLKIYPEMRHQILKEIGYMEVWNDVLSYMQGGHPVQEEE